jgi:hypothetical protein
MPNGVRIVGAGHREKHLEVIGGLPCLALKVVFSSGDEFLIGVVSIFVVAALVTAGSDHDSLGSPLWPPLVAFGASLRTHTGCLERHPSTTVGGHLGDTVDKNNSDRLLARGVLGGNVEQLLRGLWLIAVEVMNQGSTIHSGPEH